MVGLGPVPLAGQLLADLGANVIIIDRVSGDADHTDINRRNKRSIALNLKSAAGLEAAKNVIDTADILIEGFRPGVMEKLGLGAEECFVRNPGLIYGRMTGWGQEGPLASTAGHDINYLALTGALHAIGRKGEPPVPPLNLAADYGGGSMFLVMGVLSALFERSLSGKGQVVDSAMIDGVPAMMGLIHTLYARQSWVAERESNMLDGGAPYYRCYETLDAKHIAVGAIEPQFFAELVALAGLPAEDCDIQNSQEHWPDMHRRFEEVFRSKTRAEWESIFAQSDGCVAPVLNFDEAQEHEHNTSRGVFLKQQDVLQAAPAPRFGRTPAKQPASPLAPGSSSAEVLSVLGYSAEKLEKMRASGDIT